MESILVVNRIVAERISSTVTITKTGIFHWAMKLILIAKKLLLCLACDIPCNYIGGHIC